MTRRAPPSEFSGTARPVPCLTVRADEAPWMLGISPSLWGKLVIEGHLPKPFNPPGHSGVALYLVDDIRLAIQNWKDGPASGHNHADEIK